MDQAQARLSPHALPCSFSNVHIIVPGSVMMDRVHIVILNLQGEQLSE